MKLRHAVAAECTADSSSEKGQLLSTLLSAASSTSTLNHECWLAVLQVNSAEEAGGRGRRSKGWHHPAPVPRHRQLRPHESCRLCRHWQWGARHTQPCIPAAAGLSGGLSVVVDAGAAGLGSCRYQSLWGVRCRGSQGTLGCRCPAHVLMHIAPHTTDTCVEDCSVLFGTYLARLDCSRTKHLCTV